MAIFEKATGEFIGHIVLGRSDAPGILEPAALLHEKFWGKGIGKEIAIAMQELLPALLQADFKLDGVSITGVLGTAHIDNVASKKLMENVGMKTDGTKEEKYGAQRYTFIQEISCDTASVKKSPVNTLGLFSSVSVVGPSQEESLRSVFVP